VISNSWTSQVPRIHSSARSDGSHIQIAASATAAYLASHGTSSIVEASAHGYRVGSIGVAIILAVGAVVAGVFITSRPTAQPNTGATPTQLKVDSESSDLTYEPEAL
jgi:hypothetical protein